MISLSSGPCLAGLGCTVKLIFSPLLDQDAQLPDTVCGTIRVYCRDWLCARKICRKKLYIYVRDKRRMFPLVKTNDSPLLLLLPGDDWQVVAGTKPQVYSGSRP